MKGHAIAIAIAIAVSCVAILFGCLAMTAQAGRSPHQLLGKQAGDLATTAALYLASSRSTGNTTTAGAYHTDEHCFESLDDETKAELVKIISCTAKCYCHSDRMDDVCYCCQPAQGCYNTLQECQAKCPACNPRCQDQDGTTAAAAAAAAAAADGRPQLRAATNNATL